MRKSRRTLLNVIDARLASTESDNERKALELCKRSLEAEESVQQAVGATDGLTLESEVADEGARAPGLGLEDVPDEIAKLVGVHRDELRQAVVRLQSSFCLNQWNYVKPEDGRKR